MFIRKIDKEGYERVGKIHSYDFGYDFRFSNKQLKSNSVLMPFDWRKVETYKLDKLYDIPQNTEWLLEYETKVNDSLVEFIYTDKQKFVIQKSGLYWVYASDFVNTPVEAQITYTTLKLKHNSITYVIDTQSTSVWIPGGGAGYLHTSALQGGLILDLIRDDTIKFYFEFQSNLTNQILSVNHSGFCNFVLLKEWDG